MVLIFLYKIFVVLIHKSKKHKGNRKIVEIEKILQKKDLKIFLSYYKYDIIKNNPVLTKKDLDKLILEYKKTGDNLIHDKIILSNAGLVLRIAQKFSFGCPSIDIADLFHEGIKGLIEALGRFYICYSMDKKIYPRTCKLLRNDNTSLSYRRSQKENRATLSGILSFI